MDDKQQMEKSIKELEQLLKKIEYSKDKKEIEKIDQPFFMVLKECIKQNSYIVSIGNFTINFLPEELYVSYEDSNTYIEASNMDYYEETTRMGENKIYLVTDNNARVYGSTSVYILVEEAIFNINGAMSDNYYLEIKNASEPIRNYLKSTLFEVNENQAMLSLPISKEDKKINIEAYLNMDKLKRAKFVPNTQKFIIEDSYKEDLSYQQLIPNIDTKKKIISILYKLIIEFYKEWMLDRK